MVIKTGLSSFQSYISQGYTSNFSPSNTSTRSQLGKVFGVVLDEITPSQEAFESVGGFAGIGAVFYLDYNSSKNLTLEEVNLLDCSIAYPFDATIKNYPLVGETIAMIDGPSPSTQFLPSVGSKYYLGTVNVWNNPQINAPVILPGANKTFSESADIRPLQPFAGDFIIQTRRGSGLRFGTTVKDRSFLNEWSSIGNNGDPITILVNGYVTTDTGSLTPNIEEINKEISSIYLTSTQKLPLTPGASIINPVLSTLPPDNYINSQIILNSDRVTLNSKKDEVLLYAKTNIGLNTDNNIVLNAGQNVHINIESSNPDSKILLGTKTNNTAPDEPVLLGNQTVVLLEQLITTLNMLGSYMASATVPTSDGSIAIPAINDAGIQLLNSTSNLCDQLLKITSDKVYTV
jgi:hypothetical protein